MPSGTNHPDSDLYIFRATLVGFRGVSRKLAVRSDQTLTDLHQLIYLAFDWYDDHLYAFWLSGKFWGDHEGAFATPDSAREIGFRSARIRLDQLGLEVGQTLAYVFDFGDEWRVRLKLSEIRPAVVTELPGILDRRGESPPQYGWDDAEVA